jgi:hypothetical protein
MKKNLFFNFTFLITNRNILALFKTYILRIFNKINEPLHKRISFIFKELDNLIIDHS